MAERDKGRNTPNTFARSLMRATEVELCAAIARPRQWRSFGALYRSGSAPDRESRADLTSQARAAGLSGRRKCGRVAPGIFSAKVGTTDRQSTPDALGD